MLDSTQSNVNFACQVAVHEPTKKVKAGAFTVESIILERWPAYFPRAYFTTCNYARVSVVCGAVKETH